MSAKNQEDDQDVELNDAEAQQEETGALWPNGTDRDDDGLHRYKKMGLLALILLGASAIAVIILDPSSQEPENQGINSKPSPVLSSETTPRARETLFAGDDWYDDTPEPRTHEPTDEPTPEPTETPEPTISPTTPAPTISPMPSPSPTKSPTASPTGMPSTGPSMAPTNPKMGCRRDRFDNEENIEENNKLFAGSYVCSDDDDQRYMFGIDPNTGNLIWRDTFTGQVKTLYHNKWHKNFLQQQAKAAKLKLQAPPFPADEEETQYNLPTNTSLDCLEWVRVTKNGDNSAHEWVIRPNCSDTVNLEDGSTLTISVTQVYDDEDAVNDTDIVAEGLLEAVYEDTTLAPTKAPSPTPTPTAVPTPTISSRPTTVVPTLSPSQEIFVDYYFSLSIEAAFRIHRIYRTADYEIVDEVLHWELPSTYDISEVYVNCLFTHDCPYMHLHQDGVMVLAWLDYELSNWSDGWMEKNIKRCYDFDTTDVL